jgi:hypothetical protein
MTDARALQTLFDTYWSPAGWRSDAARRPDERALDHAKRCGVMFEPVSVDHDDLIGRIVDARDKLEPRSVADAFLASLTTRRLELRSVLSTYSIFRHIPAHRANFVGKACAVCGLYGPSDQAEDLNVLNFERFKWGGVRHDQPLYAALDLELFLKESPPFPTVDDAKLFRTIISALRAAPPSTTSAQVHRYLPKSLKSNKAERDVVVAALGFSGILATGARRSYRARFVSPIERELPDRRFVDMAYPACWWSAADGLDESALSEYSSHVL